MINELRFCNNKHKQFDSNFVLCHERKFQLNQAAASENQQTAYAKPKGADQLRGHCTADQRLSFHYPDSNRTRSETQIVCFHMTPLICLLYIVSNLIKSQILPITQSVSMDLIQGCHAQAEKNFPYISLTIP